MKLKSVVCILVHHLQTYLLTYLLTHLPTGKWRECVVYLLGSPVMFTVLTFMSATRMEKRRIFSLRYRTYL